MRARQDEFGLAVPQDQDDRELLGSLVPGMKRGPAATIGELLKPDLRRQTYNSLAILLDSCVRAQTESVGCSIQIVDGIFGAYQMLGSLDEHPHIALLNLSMSADLSSPKSPRFLADLGPDAERALHEGGSEYWRKVTKVGGLYLWAALASQAPDCSMMLYTTARQIPSELQPFLLVHSPLRLFSWGSVFNNEFCEAILSTVKARLRRPLENAPDKVVELIRLANRLNAAMEGLGDHDTISPLIDLWRESVVSGWKFQDLFVPWFVRLERGEMVYETLSDWLRDIQELGLIQTDLEDLYDTLMSQEFGNIAHPSRFIYLIDRFNDGDLTASETAECRQAQAFFTSGIGAFQRVGNLLQLERTRFELWSSEIAKIFGSMVDQAQNPDLGGVVSFDSGSAKQTIQNLKTYLDYIFRLPQLVSMWGKRVGIQVDVARCHKEFLESKLDGKQGRPCLPVMPDLIEFMLENWHSNVIDSPCIPEVVISQSQGKSRGLSISLTCAGAGARVLDVGAFHCDNPQDLHRHYRKNDGSSLIAQIHGGFQIVISGYDAYDSRDGQVHPASEYLADEATRLEGTSQRFVFPFVERPDYPRGMREGIANNLGQGSANE